LLVQAGTSGSDIYRPNRLYCEGWLY